ncbi:MAG: pth, peptidyl-tRNA hydrolase [Candidatus Saccharibacteria bacterium]|nr:pth, peptidyl-tRNA hydrolase [Candidatus Saccharibacteria bacterium]
MKIIFAQGNPGNEYTTTRHNVGFLMLDRYGDSHRAEFIKKPRFHADIAETHIGSEKVLLVKPTTFYNETGQAARLLIDFYKLDPATDFLVIHDDLALPFGTIRTREKGSDAGNNGIKSLNAHIGPNYRRIRIGIYTDLRKRMPDADFVLSHFSTKEKNALSDVYILAERFLNSFIDNKFEITKVSLPSIED